MLEIATPTIRQDLHGNGLPQEGLVLPLGRVETCDISNAEPTRVLGNPLEAVARLNQALINHAKVKAGALALQEPLHHVRPLEAHPELEAGHAGFGHNDSGAAYSKLITNTNCLLVDSVNGEILSEAAPCELTVFQFAPPVVIMLARIDIDRFPSRIEFRDALPYNETGKLLRRKVRADLMEEA